MTAPESGAAQPTVGTAWWLLMTPLLFVLASMATFYAANAVEIRLADMLAPLGLGILAAMAITALVFALVRKVSTAALWSSALTATFFYYGRIYSLVRPLHLKVKLGPIALGTNRVIATVLVVSFVALVFVSRHQRYVEFMARTVAVLGLCLAAGALTSSVLAQSSLGQVAAKPHTPAAAQESSTSPVTGRSSLGTDAPLPDIYYVVLDGYASSDSLKDFAGYDNTGFTGELERKGFSIAGDSRSNYSITFLSLAATLNMEYVNERAASIVGADRQPMYDLIANNRVKKTLKEHGYSYVHVASGWAGTDEAPDADYFHKSQQKRPSTAMSRIMGDDSPVRRRRATVKGAFAYLENSTRIEGPKFVFAHILMPHGPYVFEADGSTAPGTVSDMRTWNLNSIPPYVAQVQATNAMTLDFVDTLLRKRTRPTIIVIQADHGTLFPATGNLDPETTLHRRRHSILNAMYYSEGQLEELYPSISSVNTFRVVLDKAIGADLPLLADRSYFSKYNTPYKFTDVTDSIR